MLLNALGLPVWALANRPTCTRGVRCGYGEVQVGTHITALQGAVLTITVLPVPLALPLTMVRLPVDRAGTLVSMSSIAGMNITAAAAAADDDDASTAPADDDEGQEGGGGCSEQEEEEGE